MECCRSTPTDVEWFAWFASLPVEEQRVVLADIPQVAASLGYRIDEDALAAQNFFHSIAGTFAPVFFN